MTSICKCTHKNTDNKTWTVKSEIWKPYVWKNDNEMWVSRLTWTVKSETKKRLPFFPLKGVRVPLFHSLSLYQFERGSQLTFLLCSGGVGLVFGRVKRKEKRDSTSSRFETFSITHPMFSFFTERLPELWSNWDSTLWSYFFLSVPFNFVSMSLEPVYSCSGAIGWTIVSHKFSRSGNQECLLESFIDKKLVIEQNWFGWPVDSLIGLV